MRVCRRRRRRCRSYDITDLIYHIQMSIPRMKTAHMWHVYSYRRAGGHAIQR